MKTQARPGRFTLVWFIAGIAVIPLSLAIFALIVTAITSLNLQLHDPYYSDDPWTLSLAIIWLANGCCIGFLQKAIVKRYLHVDLGRWPVYTVLGTFLAGTIAYSCLDASCMPPQIVNNSIASEVYFTVEFGLVALVYLTLLSAVQGLGLRRPISDSLRWVTAHLVSQLLAMLAWLGILIALEPIGYDMIISLAFSVVFVTMASGIVMRRMMLSNRLAASSRRDEWAFQPVPAGKAARRSIWDEAL